MFSGNLIIEKTLNLLFTQWSVFEAMFLEVYIISHMGNKIYVAVTLIFNVYTTHSNNFNENTQTVKEYLKFGNNV